MDDNEQAQVEWWNDHRNLATLYEWLERYSNNPQDGPAYFMEKPWKWNMEYDAMLILEFQKAPLNSSPGQVLKWIKENM